MVHPRQNPFRARSEMGEAVSSAELKREIESRGWEVRLSEDCAPNGRDSKSFQAFFRGWQTEWRGSLEQVLADVKAYQEPEKVNE